MSIDYFNVIASALVGGSAGAVAGWLVYRRRSRSATDAADYQVIDLDPDLDMRINQSARDWAVSHGRPAMAGIVADKLRLGMRIRERWRRGRWSR